MHDYSVLGLPPTLRAVQGANPYVQLPTNILYLASFGWLRYLAAEALSDFHHTPGTTLRLINSWN